MRCGTSARPSPRQAGEVRRSQDLMSAAQGVLDHAGIELVLALLKAGGFPTPDAPCWPVFLSELVRHEPGEPLYVALPERQIRPEPLPQQPVRLADEFRKMGLT